MIILVLFAFAAGIVTILSPCILPILPIVLAGSVGGHRRPFGIVTGFVLSFTFFTLFLATIVRSFGISADALRLVSVIIIGLFGIALVLPQAQKLSEIIFSKLSSKMPVAPGRTGFWGGVLIGLSLGLIWTPCVGPILAAVITLAATASISSQTILITLAYSLGTAIPMFFIMYSGRKLFEKIPWLLRNTGKIQKIFGILMILTALMIYFNIDRKFQSFILDKFPQYGVGLTQFEDNEAVKEQLKDLGNDDSESSLLNENSPDAPDAPELIQGGQWFNSPPLELSDLRGKVILIDFWTYTCINCIRTLPYLKDWHEKYKDDGLVIIGVHTPEFEFEKNPDNLKSAIADYGLTYSVMQDNDYATWRAYNNRFWPAKYLIDKNGKIQYTHFGEGKYDETEEMIQKLLREMGATIDKPIANVEYSVEARTPELYLGLSRLSNFSSKETPELGKKRYSITSILPNTFAYSGIWTLSDEYANPDSKSSLLLNFNAKDVFLVMRTNDGKSGSLDVFLDDKKVKTITISEDKLYDIVRLDKAGTHEIRLEFNSSNIEIFAFTFG